MPVRPVRQLGVEREGHRVFVVLLWSDNTVTREPIVPTGPPGSGEGVLEIKANGTDAWVEAQLSALKDEEPSP